MTVKLAIPSKGRLLKDTIDWFASREIQIERAGAEREYAGRISGLPDVELALLAAGEIPRELAAGRITLGVTGSDVVHERVAGWETKITALARLGFGHANLVLAVPKTWADVSDLDDLDAAAEAFRRNHGFRLRIATKYHRLVRAHLKEAGVAGYQLVDSQGATEGAVVNLAAEAIADITSTGTTLDANHLKVIGGVIHASEATLFLSKNATLDDAEQSSLENFLQRIGV